MGQILDYDIPSFYATLYPGSYLSVSMPCLAMTSDKSASSPTSNLSWILPLCSGSILMTWPWAP